MTVHTRVYSGNTGTAHINLHRLPGSRLQCLRRIKTRRPLWPKHHQLQASMINIGKKKRINFCGYSAGLMDKDTLWRRWCHLSLQGLCSDNIWWFYCGTFINPVDSPGDSTAAHLDSSAVEMMSPIETKGKPHLVFRVWTDESTLYRPALRKSMD